MELLHEFDPSRVGKILSRNNPDYAFKNVILCPECRKPFMGSASRGRSGARFPAYHCDRVHKRIARSKASFEQALAAYVASLSFAPQASEFVARAIMEKFSQRREELERSVDTIARAVADLELEKTAVVEAFKRASSAVMREALEADVTRVEGEIAKAKPQCFDIEISEAELRGYVTDIAMILEHHTILLESL